MIRASLLLAAWSLSVLPLVTVMPAMAQSQSPWVEPRYDPKPGSVWSLFQQSREEVTAGSVTQWHAITSHATIIFEERAQDGFRISFVVNTASVDGNQNSVPLMRLLSQALTGERIEGHIDMNGSPLSIDNAVVFYPRISETIERMAALEEDPAKAAMAHRMFSNIFLAEGQAAADMYLAVLKELATSQNTGMQPGEVRLNATEEDFAGIPMQSEMKLTLVEASDGRAHYHKSEDYTPDSLRNLMAIMARHMAETEAKDAVAIEQKTRELAATIRIEREGGSDYFVEDGMTRRIETETIARATGLGQESVRHSLGVVTLVPAP